MMLSTLYAGLQVLLLVVLEYGVKGTITTYDYTTLASAPYQVLVRQYDQQRSTGELPTPSTGVPSTKSLGGPPECQTEFKQTSRHTSRLPGTCGRPDK